MSKGTAEQKVNTFAIHRNELNEVEIIICRVNLYVSVVRLSVCVRKFKKQFIRMLNKIGFYIDFFFLSFFFQFKNAAHRSMVFFPIFLIGSLFVTVIESHFMLILYIYSINLAENFSHYRFKSLHV